MDQASHKVVVCGAGGFIGGHLVRCLEAQGIAVRAVDIKPLARWYQVNPRAENLVLNLQDFRHCQHAVDGMSSVYQLAADMGGMGFIESNRALCMLSSIINSHMLVAAQEAGVRRFFYSSSACVYNAEKQTSPDVAPLSEDQAWPAMPEEGYGLEKLFGEQMCIQFERDFGLACRIARYHNVYGPYGTWTGGREKAPAAICRKVIEAKLTGRNEIEIWGDGTQTRSFMYIDDCIAGTCMLFDSSFNQPLNIGSSELVSINQLVDLVEEIAGVKLRRRYLLSAPKGVNGRNSDNRLILETLHWQPTIRLRDGLASTYTWIEKEMLALSRPSFPRLPSIAKRPGLALLRPSLVAGPHLIPKSRIMRTLNEGMPPHR